MVLVIRNDGEYLIFHADINLLSFLFSFLAENINLQVALCSCCNVKYNLLNNAQVGCILRGYANAMVDIFPAIDLYHCRLQFKLLNYESEQLMCGFCKMWLMFTA